MQVSNSGVVLVISFMSDQPEQLAQGNYVTEKSYKSFLFSLLLTASLA